MSDLLMNKLSIHGVVLCPCGGQKTNTNWDKYNKQDFFVGASFTCQNCDVSYQYVETEKILSVATDLNKYYGEQP